MALDIGQNTISLIITSSLTSSSLAQIRLNVLVLAAHAQRQETREGNVIPQRVVCLEDLFPT